MNVAAKPRIANDFYPTDHGFTRVMLESLPVRLSGRISEPCAGQRDIVQCLRQHGLDVIDSDIVDGPGMDATTAEFWLNQSPIDWTVTNPPFNVATKILQKAYEYSRCGVLFFLRITYLEPCPDRYQWLDEYADQLRWMQVVNPRPIYRSDTNKTDSATCCWLLWDKSWSWRSMGIEPPFRFSHGSRSTVDSRKTVFTPSQPKLPINSSVVQSINLQKADRPPSQRAINFCSSGNQPTERKSVTIALRLIDALTAEVDALKFEGVAGPTQYLNEQAKGDRTYYLLRWVEKGRVRAKSLKPSGVSEVRARIVRRNEVQSLECRISETHKIIQKLEGEHTRR